MKKSKFTDSQILEAIKRVEAGLAVPDLCREIGKFINLTPPLGESHEASIDFNPLYQLPSNLILAYN